MKVGGTAFALRLGGSRHEAPTVNPGHPSCVLWHRVPLTAGWTVGMGPVPPREALDRGQQPTLHVSRDGIVSRC